MAEREQERVKEIIRILRREYPEAKCSLDFETPFQLLAATILSAQCTDDRVNKVTPALFRRYPTAEKMSKAPLAQIEKLIKTTGFFRNKAVSLKEMSKAVYSEHGGVVPNELEKLVALRGVGRKTANVILGVAFGIPGMVVDTHIGRLARRLGLTQKKDPVHVEQDLMKLVPRDVWTEWGHLMIHHGRAICSARRARCDDCPIARFCPKIGAH
jgi:endonuclease-3